MTGSHINPLLVVLDLNGTLLYRSRKGKTCYPRPYLSLFLQYLFHPFVSLPMDGKRAIKVMVWSSARPDNIARMVNTIFGTFYTPELVAIWDRTHLNLSEGEYEAKVEVVKDLSLIWDAFDGQYSEANTILIDDSLLKARLQPSNHLHIPEYTKPSPTLPSQALDGLSTPAQRAIDFAPLAIIGMLETLRTVQDVRAWMRSDAILSTSDNTRRNPGPFTSLEACDMVFQGNVTTHYRSPWFKYSRVVMHWTRSGWSALQKYFIN